MGRIFWYTRSNGRSPVQEDIALLPDPDRAKIDAYVSHLAALGSRLGPPEVKTIEGKLKELRIPIGRGHYRIFFFFMAGDDTYLLHSFLKKTQKTPQKEKVTATNRMKLIMSALRGKS